MFGLCILYANFVFFPFSSIEAIFLLRNMYSFENLYTDFKFWQTVFVVTQ